MDTFTEKQKEAYQRAAVICSKAEKSSGNIFRKLKDWDLREDEALAVVEKLISEKFIDDERYAQSYVRDKFRFNKWGKIKIAFQLKADKINSRIIESALDEIDDLHYYEALKDLLVSKDKSIKAVNHFDRKAKLFRFAQGRGYEADLIYSVIDELLTR